MAEYNTGLESCGAMDETSVAVVLCQLYDEAFATNRPYTKLPDAKPARIA
jgi:hypothetical protein